MTKLKADEVDYQNLPRAEERTWDFLVYFCFLFRNVWRERERGGGLALQL